ncbi:hypothetical protein HAP47_0040085 [Bradyrhizobium sp. 41S5]|uniref:hypothetical protein n=1 Tax=Bradyrhizobium sp. 41S5 TaxID=1404443 RepID=UPI00156A88F2|nr:hypothetical protein [Bradyrhizobium sp. 41S5]UFX45084.1 hypothetical protein HAP47_0040085 [Bradyrhizobium sp. 41S5]
MKLADCTAMMPSLSSKRAGKFLYRQIGSREPRNNHLVQGVRLAIIGKISTLHQMAREWSCAKRRHESMELLSIYFGQ